MIVLVKMGLPVDFIAAGEDEDAPFDTDHVDGCAIEPRQHGRGDDLPDGSDRRMAVAEIEDPVENPEERVQLMRTEQHGDAEFGLNTLHQFDGVVLMGGVQADERLIQQK